MNLIITIEGKLEDIWQHIEKLFGFGNVAAVKVTDPITGTTHTITHDVGGGGTPPPPVGRSSSTITPDAGAGQQPPGGGSGK